MLMRKRPKILLIVVYSKDMLKAYEEAGTSMIAAYLRSHQYEVEIIAQTEKNIDYKYIKAYAPQIVGFTVYKVSKAAVDKVSLKVREILPNSLFCLGGYEATCRAEVLLNEMPHIHLCIRGEGEVTFLEVAKAVENDSGFDNIDGLTYRKGGDIITNANRKLIADLDELPYMSRDILKNNGLHIAQIWTSRGCKGYCTFCISRKFWKNWRGRSVEHVVDEIEYVRKTYNIDMFYFIDGSFEDPDDDCSRLQNLAQTIINRNLNIYYMALFRSEFVNKATPELMELLVKSGLFNAFVGIEAANEEDLKLFCKKGNVNDSTRVMELFKKYNIGLQIGFIVYHPYSKFENIVKNIDFLERNNYISRFFGYTNLEGTPLSRKIEKDGLNNSSSDVGYNFVDPNVEKRLIFINRYYDEYAELDFTYRVINNVTNDLNFIYPNILRRCERYQLDECIQYVNNYYNQSMRWLSEVNYVIGEWLKSLFKIDENEWDEQTIIKESFNYWKECKLSESINQLQLIRSKFYMKINNFKIPDIDDLSKLTI